MVVRFIKSLFMYGYSLLFCLRYLPFKQAIKVPIYISPSVRIKQLKKGDIIFNCPLRRSLATIGFEGNVGLNQQRATILVKNGGKIVFHGAAIILGGTSLSVQGAMLSLGDNFICNTNCFISCVRKNITIGNDTIFGWNVVLNTSNGHPVFIDGRRSVLDDEITIGSHVWICSYANIAKGVEIADGCIVAQNSLVLRNQLTSNALIAGNPAKIVKENVDWNLYID